MRVSLSAMRNSPDFFRRRRLSLLRIVRPGQCGERQGNSRPRPPTIRLTPRPRCSSRKRCSSLSSGIRICAGSGAGVGEGFLERLLKSIPTRGWSIQRHSRPTEPFRLNLNDWHRLSSSQRERELILKVLFSDTAWGAGVYLGSDLSVGEWSEAVDLGLRSFPRSPFVLQRYHKPRTVESSWVDFTKNELVEMRGRAGCVRLFRQWRWGQRSGHAGWVLATICPQTRRSSTE